MTEIRSPQRLWLVALIIAWAVDLLFWNTPAGVSYLIWIALGTVGMFALALGEGRRPPAASYVLAVINLALAATLLLRSEPFTCFLGGFISLIGSGMLAMTLTTGNWLRFRLGDIIVAMLSIVASGVVRGGELLTRRTAPTEPNAEASASKGGTRRHFFPILRGLLLALPVVAVLAALLASADLVFAERLEGLLDIFKLDNLVEYLFRLGYVLVLTYAFAGLLAQSLSPKGSTEAPNPHEPWKARFLGSTETFIILGSVVALFVFFLAIQFQYLFGGQANITTAGFTYSDYARRGFFELVAVAILSLSLYLLLSTITRRTESRQQTTFSGLSIVLIALVLVILVSALQRLLLYEQAYGFTRLRTYTHIFIPWLALLLAVTIILEVIRRPGHFGLALVLCVFGFSFTFPILNVDGLIARLNLDRVRAGQVVESNNMRGEADLDARHLTDLSADAVPVIAAAYADPRIDAATRDQLGAVLGCHYIKLPEDPNWRSFRIPEATARAIFARLDLSDYVKGAGVKLNGEEFPCYWDYMD